MYRYSRENGTTACLYGYYERKWAFKTVPTDRQIYLLAITCIECNLIAGCVGLAWLGLARNSLPYAVAVRSDMSASDSKNTTLSSQIHNAHSDTGRITSIDKKLR